jgi:hypothetical protein
MQMSVNRTGLVIVGTAVLLCAVAATCLFGGYGYLQLRPLPTPTLSFVDSVRATATAQAEEAAGQPTPTSTPSPTAEPTAAETPTVPLEPTSTPTLEPTPEPQATATTAPSGPPAPPPPTSTPRPQPTNTPRPTRNTSLVRGPYLQWVRSQAITIVWETVDQVDSVVEYGPTAAYGASASDFNWSDHHEVTLTGLNPYTVYHYRVRSSGQVLSRDHTFKTAAGAGQSNFTFVVFGDTNSGIDPAKDHMGRYRNSATEGHTAAMVWLDGIRPDFYLLAGDLVARGAEMSAWDEFFSFEEGTMANLTMFPTMGEGEGNHYNYFRLFSLPNNERWYSFDYGNAHFICLEIDGYQDASSGSEQYTWLQNDLAKTDKTWKIAFFHYPPYSYGPVGSKPEARAVHSLFTQYGVDLVFSAHDRNYQRFVVDGVTYIVTGGGGAATGNLSGGAEFPPVYMEEMKHVMRVTVSGNTLSSVAIRTAPEPVGEEVDPFTLTAQ